MKFQCRTFFDITATGITGHFKLSQLPYTDRAGQIINNQQDWHRSRNQQRNWETLNQLLSMRTQVFGLSNPEKVNDHWQFEFDVENPSVFGSNEDPVFYLKQDANMVPMMPTLTNSVELPPMLSVDGVDQNIWFKMVDINKQ